jgi:hypothetical protein
MPMVLPLVLSILTAAVPQRTSGPPNTDALTTVRAYVFTDTSSGGGSSADTKSRLEAVRELKDALARKKGISLVDRREDATLLIEVTGHEQHEDESGPFGGRKLTPLGDAIIRFHISSGGEESDLKGMGQGTTARAAKDAADRILKWIARREPPRKSRS